MFDSAVSIFVVSSQCYQGTPFEFWVRVNGSLGEYAIYDDSRNVCLERDIWDSLDLIVCPMLSSTTSRRHFEVLKPAAVTTRSPMVERFGLNHLLLM